jgi:hypothetical protein
MVKPTITCMVMHMFGIVLCDQTVSWVPRNPRLFGNFLCCQVYAMIGLAVDATINL